MRLQKPTKQQQEQQLHRQRIKEGGEEEQQEPKKSNNSGFAHVTFATEEIRKGRVDERPGVSREGREGGLCMKRVEIGLGCYSTRVRKFYNSCSTFVYVLYTVLV